MQAPDHFGARRTIETSQGRVEIYDFNVLEKQGLGEVSCLPFTVRIMLESLIRNVDGFRVKPEHVEQLAAWQPDPPEIDVPLIISRVVLQDFTGVPVVVDLAAMRDALAELGGDPELINPVIPCDLVIDHSVQVDYFGTLLAYLLNVRKEYERNRERYQVLKWAQQSLSNFRVVPPGTGIVHQVNLEYLSQVVHLREVEGRPTAFPDTLVGTDSHTTMVNGLGVFGWGVGGIEAEAVMLGQPYYLPAPRVVGLKLVGELPEGATATDLVLTITELLRAHGVVGKFVEVFGPGLSSLTVADRATIANMSPEFGCTQTFFPVDEETLAYLRLTGRDPAHVELVERYLKEVGLFRTDQTPDPLFSEVVELDMGRVEPSLAGPKRPQDRVSLSKLKESFRAYLVKPTSQYGYQLAEEELARRETVELDGTQVSLTHGSVVIAAITSCTNTSNPSVMLGAGLLAKKAVEKGLDRKPWVKTSLAPGSKVVTDYLERAGLTPYLEALGFHLVGYGCTTCIGNSGPLPEPIVKAIQQGNLVAVAVLSGNRNFEGRINPHTRANYLASPMLVVAFALAGRIDIDLEEEPLGHDPNGQPIYLRDIWPTPEEIQAAIHSSLDPEMFRREYARVFEGDQSWQELEVSGSVRFEWNPLSTYIRRPPFFEGMGNSPKPLEDIVDARVLVLLGDSVTTDHISPAGTIPVDSPAGQYLIDKGVKPAEFNSFGSRRGNHEVMIRGTFGNIRLKNLLVAPKEGGYTLKLPEGEEMTIYEAASRYQEEGVPLVVLAGREYGTGSSRDWAAKGTALLGVKAVIAESYERIHRSNLIGMGVLPLEFLPGEGWQKLGLTGREAITIQGIAEGLSPKKTLTVIARRDDGSTRDFQVVARLDNEVELEYYRHGGILPYVLRQMLKVESRVKG